MIKLICFAVFGLIVGFLTKIITGEKEFGGIFGLMLLGVAGSLGGGLIHFLLFHEEGVRMGNFFYSILGGIIFCVIHNKFLKV